MKLTGLCIIVCSFRFRKCLYGHVCCAWCDTPPPPLSTSSLCRLVHFDAYNYSWPRIMVAERLLKPHIWAIQFITWENPPKTHATAQIRQVSNGTLRILRRWKSREIRCTSNILFRLRATFLIANYYSGLGVNFHSFSAANLHRESCENQKSGSYNEHLGMSEDEIG